MMEVLKLVTKQVPTDMNGPEFRSNISHLYCHAFSKAFPGVIRTIYDKEHDMEYIDEATGVRETISLKSMISVFQKRNKKCPSKLTQPGKIMFINVMGDNKQEKIEKTLDSVNWILVIQRGGNSAVGYALISGKNLKELIHKKPSCISASSDQIKLNITNSDYDHFGGLETISINESAEVCTKRNQNFQREVYRLFDSVLEFSA
jgi:hypothetical protein